MGLLFESQPNWCREKLDISKIKNFDSLSTNLKNIVLFDPSEIYKRIDDANVINPFNRYNSISIGLLFPQLESGLCRCGCGTPLIGRRRVWANDKCKNLPINVQCIISGHSTILTICRFVFGSECSVCGISERESCHTHELDHKHPVKFGGSGGWLSNYEFKCKKCHREKTNKDFGFNNNFKPKK
jgi:5-methylcytosine-specific restriction endonuclease McrA